MAVTWVLEASAFSHRCFDEMAAHLRRRGLPHHVVRIVPFSHEVAGEVPAVENPCVVYGSVGVAKLAAKHGWFPGSWSSEEMSCTEYARHLKEFYLNTELIVCRLSEAETRAEVLGWKNFFIRPNSDGKAFPGGIASRSYIANWLSQMRRTGLLEDNDVEVVLAPQQEIGREWRTVVVGKNVAAFSLYRKYQQKWEERSIDAEALAAVQQAITRYRPAGVFVVDVCEASDGMKIIEYNNFNTAGLYDCDVAAVIDTVSEFVESAYDADRISR
jgi:ATP-grasp domain, R2K clade family 3